MLDVLEELYMRLVWAAFLFLFLANSIAMGQDYDANKRIIVFDFGGVIAGGHNGLLEKRLAKELKISATQAKTMAEAAQQAKKLKLPEKRFWQFFSANSGIQLPKNWPERYGDIRRHIIRLKPGMMELVEELKEKGHRVAMLSNVTTNRAIAIRELGLYEPFDPAVLSCEIGCSKPSKKPFRVLLEKLGNVPAQKCIFIDDKKENIDVSNKMGFDGIVFTSCDDLKVALGKRKIYVKTW